MSNLFFILVIPYTYRLGTGNYIYLQVCGGRDKISIRVYPLVHIAYKSYHILLHLIANLPNLSSYPIPT